MELRVKPPPDFVRSAGLLLHIDGFGLLQERLSVLLDLGQEFGRPIAS